MLFNLIRQELGFKIYPLENKGISGPIFRRRAYLLHQKITVMYF